MKRILLICILLLSAWSHVEAKDGMKAVFLAMPDSLTPLLTSTNKADFIDFLDSKMKAAVTNKMEGTSEMTVITDDYLSIKMTEQSTWQMKLLATSDTTSVLCVDMTVLAGYPDSHLVFYNPKTWETIPSEDFLPEFHSAKVGDSEVTTFRRFDLSPENNQLTMTLNYLQLKPEANGEMKTTVESKTSSYEWDRTRGFK